MSVRVRFAPSPTGWLHVGGARTALFNYLFAKKHKGSFILRIEDTDQNRHQEEALTPLLNNLQWLGLKWDEGPVLKHNSLNSQGLQSPHLGQKPPWRSDKSQNPASTTQNPDKSLKQIGPYGPYRQKDRLPIYKEQALKLIREGKAYYCFMTPEQEAEQKALAIKAGQAFRVSSPYRDQPLEQAEQKIKQGQAFCIRFKTLKRENNYSFQDLVRGEMQFPEDSLGDFILIRTDGFPVYNFSCAVDDSLMKITHVFRAEEHLSNTLKQRLIQLALGFKPPVTGHLSIILGKDKKKLSKRTGATSLKQYQHKGYLPSALINFLALLGWNPGTEQEFFTKQDLIQNFSEKAFNLSAAVFDEDKLLWLNGEHIKTLSDKQLLEQLKPYLKQPVKDETLTKLIVALRSGFKTLSEGAKKIELFLSFTVNAEKALPVLKWPKSQAVIKKWIVFLQNLPQENLSLEDFKSFQKQIQAQEQVKGKEFFMPLRLALMGEPEGIEIKTLILLLTKPELIKRAKKLLSFQAQPCCPAF